MGTFSIDVIITDDKDLTPYNFYVIVPNDPPRLTSPVNTPITISFGKPVIYNLPTSMDPEGLPYTTTIIKGPSYVKKLSDTQLKLFPVNCVTDFGDQ